MDNMTLADYFAMERTGRRSKYGNTKVKADGYTFDSKAEYARYCELKLLEEAGQIEDLRVHPSFVIMDGYTEPNTGKKIRTRRYEADFRYWNEDTGQMIVEDVKGKRTAFFNLKWDLVRQRYPEFLFVLVNV